MLRRMMAWVAALAGVALVGIILWDAFETILVPRRIGRRVRLTRYFYILTWRARRALALGIRGTSSREYVLGAYGPLSLIGLLACWAMGLIGAFALIQVGANMGAGGRPEPLWQVIYMSGETFFTLGFGDVTPASAVGRFAAVVEAGMGFGFLGTVVGYLPTMYSAFAAREVEISLMDARAGSPPTAAEYLGRIAMNDDHTLSDGLMRDWERWSAQLLETHVSYPQLAYYRSQHLNQSWVGSVTAILDASAFLIARDGEGATRQTPLTFAMARHALVDVSQIFVSRPPAHAPERFGPAERVRFFERLRERGVRIADDEEAERRLCELRRLYEPYAQALAGYLLIELPPWVAAGEKRDNWQGGPWDRMLSASRGPNVVVSEDHF